jgi:hypothetical protein
LVDYKLLDENEELKWGKKAIYEQYDDYEETDYEDVEENKLLEEYLLS